MLRSTYDSHIPPRGPKSRTARRTRCTADTPKSDTEEQFWFLLAYRLGSEFAGLTKPLHRSMWCDGIEPVDYLFADGPPRITGNAWICGKQRWNERWAFTLLLPASVRSCDQINWWALLPPDNMTCWISFDERQRHLEIDPAAAVPDLK